MAHLDGVLPFTKWCPLLGMSLERIADATWETAPEVSLVNKHQTWVDSDRYNHDITQRAMKVCGLSEDRVP